MFNRFVKEAREIAAQAQTVAQGLGSPTIEAEHLLLALTEAGATRATLAEAGLDWHGLRDALAREAERSLAAVGISATAVNLPPPAHAGTKARWATSAKLALERSLKVATARKDSRIRPDHILLGVLQAPLGTVPRALEVAGVDRLAIARRVEAELAHAR